MTVPVYNPTTKTTIIPMKKYLIFGYDNYGAYGGFNDYTCSTDDLNLIDNYSPHFNTPTIVCDYYDYFNMETGEYVHQFIHNANY